MSRIIKLGGAAALITIALAAQIKRGDSVSNFAHGLGAVGITVPPSWAAPLADNWVSGLALVALSGLVFWSTFRPRPGDAGSESKPDVPAVPYPDWSIAALFLHLDPSLDGADNIEQSAEPTGRAVLEKLISGDLKAWGKLDGSSSALRPIEPAFWRQADWTYWFLPDEKRNRDLVHATLPRAEQQYRDVHVNHAEAMSVWKR